MAKRLLLLLCAASCPALTPAAPLPPWRNTSLPVAARVSDLVSRLSLSEMAANLYANGAPGSAEAGLPAYRYDAECMRGAVTSGVNARPLGTGFPTLLALAGTWDVRLLAAVAAVGAREVRAYYNEDRRSKNLPTTANCYAPVVNVIRDPRWGRSAEMVSGECPALGRIYARAWTAAMRGGAAANSTAKLVSSVCKHLATYGGPESGPVGRFAFDAVLDERTWREYFLPAFRGAAEAGADAFMCSYTATTLTQTPADAAAGALPRPANVPDCANAYMLNGIVRGEWAWQGWVTSDADAVAQIFSSHGAANSSAAAAVAALVGGCDMELTTRGKTSLYATTLAASVRAGAVPREALTTALARALTGRFAVGDLDPPAASPWANLSAADIYAPASVALARTAARAAVVLLQNRGGSGGTRRLPWSRAALSGKAVCVAGPLANATADWMAGYAPLPPPAAIVSPLAAFAAALAGAAASVTLLPGCAPGDGVACAALQPGLAAALAACDATVLVLATSEVAHGACADVNLSREGEGCDRSGVGLPGAQPSLLAAALANAGGPLAVVLASGGMLDVGADALADARIDALLAAPFGGQWAGDAIAAAVLGDENPSAKLTTTYYTTQALARLSAISDYSMANRTYRYLADAADAAFPFGHGLSFSNFSYSDLRITPAAPAPCDTVTVSATLTNAADAPAGAEVAQLYIAIAGASVPVPRLQLVNFDKLVLAPGASAPLSLTILPEDHAVLRAGDFLPVVEPGARRLWLGSSSADAAAGGVGLAGAYDVAGAVTPLRDCGGTVGAAVWPRPALNAAGAGGAARWGA
jgi:beta-glucosidase